MTRMVVSLSFSYWLVQLSFLLLLVVPQHEVSSFVVKTKTRKTTTITRSSFQFLQVASHAFTIQSSRSSRNSHRLLSSPKDDDKDGSSSSSEEWISKDDESLSPEGLQRRNLAINAAAIGLVGISGIASASLFTTNLYTPNGFRRISPIQFVAALGDPKSTSGTNAQEWGVWPVDPGPRGVWLNNYDKDIVSQNNIAPSGWIFNENDWWLEEHGLIMEAPTFPVLSGRYLVTGGRLVTTILTIEDNGNWKLDDGTLYDVTHLPCRSARYSPKSSSSATPDDSSGSGGGDAGSTTSRIVSGSPRTANPSNFPVTPGAEMPTVSGCNKQDYAVLFIVGKAIG